MKLLGTCRDSHGLYLDLGIIQHVLLLLSYYHPYESIKTIIPLEFPHKYKENAEVLSKSTAELYCCKNKKHPANNS
jgi:hypothetical protein